MKLALAAALACAAALASTASAADPPELREQCLAPDDGAAAVFFRAADGFPLAGALFGDGKLGVVLAHQMGSDLCEWRDFALTLAGRGYRVLAIDMRGYGSSPWVQGKAPNRRDLDVVGAAAELRRRGATRVVAVGASMGGTAVVLAGARRGALDGVVSLSGAGLVTGMNGRAAAKRLRVPVRFLAARDDGQFALDAQRMHRAAPAKDDRLLIVPGAAHGSSLLGVSARVRSFVLSFLARIAAGA